MLHAETLVPNRRAFGLDLLRAVAILIVVEQHGRSLLPSSISSLGNLGGTDGVDLFFVLSGFLIGTIFLRMIYGENFSLQKFKTFVMRRWFRTLPNYYLVLVLNLALAIWLGRSTLSSSDLIKFIFFLQNFSYPFVQVIFFSESWSLAIEEYFYLMLPAASLSLFFVNGSSARRNASLLIILFLIALPLFLRHINFLSIGNESLSVWNDHYRCVVVYRLDAIAIGVVAAWFSLNQRDLWQRFALPLFGIGILSMIALDRTHIVSGTYPPSWFTAVPYFSLYPISVAMCFPMLLKLRRPKSEFRAKFIERISAWSYSIYLIHNSLIRIPLAEVKAGSQMLQCAIYLLYWCSTLGAAWLIYRCVEKPILRVRDDHFPS